MQMKPNVTKYELADPTLLELVSPEMDKWLNSWTPEQQAKYSGQYVAISRDKRVVASDEPAARLQEKLSDLGMEKVRIFYMEPANVYAVYSVHS